MRPQILLLFAALAATATLQDDEQPPSNPLTSSAPTLAERGTKVPSGQSGNPFYTERIMYTWQSKQLHSTMDSKMPSLERAIAKQHGGKTPKYLPTVAGVSGKTPHVGKSTVGVGGQTWYGRGTIKPTGREKPGEGENGAGGGGGGRARETGGFGSGGRSGKGAGARD